MAKHNWHWANMTAVVNTLTKQAWNADYWTLDDWHEFVSKDESGRQAHCENMDELTGQCVCPRCHGAMDPRRPALSRLTRDASSDPILVCSDCGVEEAILQWHNNGVPVDWRV